MDSLTTSRRLLTLLDLAFLALAAWFASQILAAVVLSPAPAGRPPSVKARQVTKTDHSASGADVSVILSRNLFGSRLAVESPSEAGGPVQELPASSLPLTLFGTVVNARGGRSLAIIQGGALPDQQVYLQGDTVSEGVTLKTVERNRVILLREGREEVLDRVEEAALPASKQPIRMPARALAQPGTAQGAVEGAPGDLTVRQVGEGTYVMDRREVEGVLQNFNQLLTQVRVVPHFADGKPDGFKVFNIRPNSLFSKLGMANGDIIKRVNGLEISGPEQALQMFAQLKEESRITLDLERFRKNLTFQYEIR